MKSTKFGKNPRKEKYKVKGFTEEEKNKVV